MGHCRWTVERFAQGWGPNPIPQALKFPAVPPAPVAPVALFNYLRPGGVDQYLRPGGVDLYKRTV